MNNKAFTLVELVATIAVLGLVSLMAFPAINNALLSNKTTACKYYEKAMIAAAKDYVQKEGPTIIDGEENGVFPSTKTIFLSTDLLSGGYIEEYNDNNTAIDMTGSSNKVIVHYKNSTNTYTYEVYLTCTEKENTGKVVYKTP